MGDLEKRIDALGDQAVPLLKMIASNLGQPIERETVQSMIDDAGLDESDQQGEPVPQPSDLEKQVAIDALKLLAQDPTYARAISHAMEVRAFTGFIEGALVMTAALVILNTSVDFKRDEDGKVSFKFKVKPASESIQKEFIKLCRDILRLPKDK